MGRGRTSSHERTSSLRRVNQTCTTTPVQFACLFHPWPPTVGLCCRGERGRSRRRRCSRRDASTSCCGSSRRTRRCCVLHDAFGSLSPHPQLHSHPPSRLVRERRRDAALRAVIRLLQSTVSTTRAVFIHGQLGVALGGLLMVLLLLQSQPPPHPHPHRLPVVVRRGPRLTVRLSVVPHLVPTRGGAAVPSAALGGMCGGPGPSGLLHSPSCSSPSSVAAFGCGAISWSWTTWHAMWTTMRSSALLLLTRSARGLRRAQAAVRLACRTPRATCSGLATTCSVTPSRVPCERRLRSAGRAVSLRWCSALRRASPAWACGWPRDDAFRAPGCLGPLLARPA